MANNPKRKHVYVDYYNHGIWGAWYNKKMIGLPNIIHHSPKRIFDILGDLERKMNVVFVFHCSDTVDMLNLLRL